MECVRAEFLFDESCVSPPPLSLSDGARLGYRMRVCIPEEEYILALGPDTH
jgi:hypothetical protein